MKRIAIPANSVLLALNHILICLLFGFTVWGLPLFAEMFEAMGSGWIDEFPRLTITFLVIPPWVYFMISVGMIVALVFKDKSYSDQKTQRRFLVLVLVGLICASAIIWGSMFLPLLMPHGGISS